MTWIFFCVRCCIKLENHTGSFEEFLHSEYSRSCFPSTKVKVLLGSVKVERACYYLSLGFRVWNKHCVIATYNIWKGKRWAHGILMCDNMLLKTLRIGLKSEAIFHRNSMSSWIIFLIIKETSTQDIKISIFNILIDLCLNWTVIHSIIWLSSSYIWIGLSRLGRPKAGLQKNKILVLESSNVSEKTR